MKSKILIILATIYSTIACSQASSYKLWFEYGNGTFISKSFTETSALMNYLNNSLPVNNNSGTNYGIKKVIKIYKPPPPPTLLLAHRLLDANPPVEFATTNAPLDSNLFLFKSTSDFLKADTIMMAIHYKKIPSAKKLAFFYNSNANASFKPITELNNAMLMPNDNGGLPKDIPQIRKFKNEQQSIATSALMSSVGAGFQNGLVFDLLNEPNTSSNIFLTMNTFEEIDIEDNENFKLVFLDASGKAIGNGHGSGMLNHSAFPSHDPNYQKVIPECLKFPEGAGTILNYDVHFQNTGLGPALTVETTTTLPEGYTINDIVDFSNLPWMVANQLRNNNYTIDVNSSRENKLIIKFTKKPSTTIILRGTLGMEDPLSDVTTMGDFSFKLKVKTPLTGPQDLTSGTSIVFDTNHPVITNDAVVRVRKCCTCPDKKKNPDGTSNSGKCRGKSKLAKWLFCSGC